MEEDKESLLKRIKLFLEDRSTKILISLFILIIPFHKVIEGFINVFVTRIFSKIDRSLPTDIVAFIIVSYLLYSLLKSIRIKAQVSGKYIFLLTILLSIYTYYRCFGSVWEFTKFSLFQEIAYLDIFIFFVIAQWIIFYKQANKKNEGDKVNQENKGFKFDKPLNKSKEDILKRAEYAKSICSKIENTNIKDNAFSIGITGEWGNGKTSFLHLIDENLSGSENIVFYFKPWFNNGPTSIINDFFKLLSLKVDKYNPSLSRKIEDYGKLLLQLGDSGLNKIVQPILHLNSVNKVAQTQYEDIDKLIAKLPKRLIVFIDDLDRLDNSEIIEVIKIIRNTANFSNTVFIAAYDRSYVINALKNINSYNNELFLEKIFQVEIVLPEYELDVIKGHFFNLIKDNLSKEDKLKLESILFDGIYILPFIKTIRDAIRLANLFNLSYSHLNKEINVKDLLYLELLKLKYPDVSNIIFDKKADFLTSKDPSNIHNQNKIYWLVKNEKEEYLLESYLSKHVSIGVKAENIPDIMEIVKILFSNKVHFVDLEPLSIADPKSFDRYFFYRLLDHNLSQVEFDKYRLESPHKFESKMKEWILSGLRSEIVDKFRVIKQFSTKDEFEKTISGIFKYARIPKQDENDYSGYEYFDLRKKLYYSIEEYGLKMEKKKVGGFIMSLLDNAPSPYVYDISFIYELLKSGDYNDLGLEKEYLNYLRLQYLKKYLDSIDKIDANVFDLHNNCNLTNSVLLAGRENNTSKENINEEANILLIKFIKEKDLYGFLCKIILPRRFESGLKYKIHSFATTLFGSFEDFGIFLEDFKTEDHESLDEFLKFYNECKKSNFEEFLDFNFRKIQIN